MLCSGHWSSVAAVSWWREWLAFAFLLKQNLGYEASPYIIIHANIATCDIELISTHSCARETTSCVSTLGMCISLLMHTGD